VLGGLLRFVGRSAAEERGGPVTESSPGRRGTQEYYVLLITDEQREATGIHWLEHRQFGSVLWLFSSMEVVEKFRGRYIDENQAFMDILERDFEQLRKGAKDINFFRAVSKATVPDLLAFLFAADIDALILDPGADGWEQRVYESPNKTYKEGGFE
jgi:hypothetical protein